MLQKVRKIKPEKRVRKNRSESMERKLKGEGTKGELKKIEREYSKKKERK